MLLSLALIFLFGLLLGAVFNKLRLPSLVGMLLTGIVLGPYALGLLDESILLISADLRKLALVIILTRAGLALDIKDLKKVGRPAILMCFIPAVLEIGGIMLLAPMLFGVTIVEAALMGAVVAAVSPAIIVPRMLKLMESGHGTDKSIPQLIMAGASVDDVFVIVLFTSFLGLAQGETVSLASFTAIPISILTGLLLGVAGGLLLTAVFKRFHTRDSAKVLILLSVSFLLISLEDKVGEVVAISGLLAVMGMSATILRTNSVLAKRLSGKFSKLWVGAEVLLFVLVGATVDISYALSAGVASVLLISGAIVFRIAGVYICLLKTKLNIKERLFCMISYSPKATVQAAIGAIPFAMGLGVGHTVLTVAVFSILITAPLGALGIDLTYDKLLVHSQH